MRTKKLTPIQLAEVEIIRQAAFRLSATQQFRLAFLIAENLNYLITPARPPVEWERHKRLEDHDVLVARGEAEPL